MNGAYEVVLGPAAKRFVLGMRDANDRKELADALRVELVNGANAGKAWRFDRYGDRVPPDPSPPPDGTYKALPLSFGGDTVVYRLLTRDELKRLHQEQGRPVARQGFFVLDVLTPESAWVRRPDLFY
jgi:hypothetical protein